MFTVKTISGFDPIHPKVIQPENVMRSLKDIRPQRSLKRIHRLHIHCSGSWLDGCEGGKGDGEV